MNARDLLLYQQLDTGLQTYQRNRRTLPGIASAPAKDCFIRQLIESIHRIRFVSVLTGRQIDNNRANPNSPLFDPLKAAILSHQNGRIDEAFWLVFIFVHFGKHSKAGWRYAREVYGRLDQGGLWDWNNVSNNPTAFRMWLDHHQAHLKRPGIPRGFGNHRKYQSLDALSPVGTGNAFQTYVDWVRPHGTHQNLVNHALLQSAGNPAGAFDHLYQSMKVVASFGRMARFDYLTMVGKLGLANIMPGSPYLNGATGPTIGAERLFGRHSVATLDAWIVQLDANLQVGMQVLEDAICNWQKSPQRFKAFRG